MDRSWPEYQPQVIEPKWQRIWEQMDLYVARLNSDKPKYYCLDFFPYPSGDGLHVGHCRNYIPTDVMSRFKRMSGYNVLHPMGWDAFGEPAEQYAVRHGVHPRVTTDENTSNFRRQMKILGTSYDWSREIDSSKPEFYRWTQFFFLHMYRKGLAYRDTNWQWWCHGCKTTLSSHEVAGGVCWRGHTDISRREIPAWYFRITAYADELISGLDDVDWPTPIKAMQRNWIGRSEGCEIIFHTQSKESVPVFTTRPDTLFGTTFFLLAPEHRMVDVLTTEEQRLKVNAYIDQATRRSEIDRLKESRDIHGVFTGGHVINPLNEERIPVWIADYVLPSYGTGAVMGVPAHDQRDFEFARKYRLPIKVVIKPPGVEIVDGAMWSEAYPGHGKLVNSGDYNDLSSSMAGKRIAADLRERGVGGSTVNYRMRDWLISRQRYWGTPIPVIYCTNCGQVPLTEDDLPVVLPDMDDFQPDDSGRSPLARNPEFVNTTCPQCGGSAIRETDTMGGFACSSWYFLRFTSPDYKEGPFDPQQMTYWMPVDLYVGGAEHAVLHLLYARFWTKVLADGGFLNFREPFTRLRNQGQLLGPDGARMAKTRGNVIIPDDIVESIGADALRIYELFMAPFDQDIAWSVDGINGARRFLNRVWNLFAETYEISKDASAEDPDLLISLHKTIRKVQERIEDFRFNTMVSTLMEFVNLLGMKYRQETWQSSIYHEALNALMILLAPVVPHIADELWSLTGHQGSVHENEWPQWDPELAREEIVQLPVQINGKMRHLVEVAVDASEDEVKELAFAQPIIRQHIAGRRIDKLIYIPGKIINIVTR